MTQRSAQHSSNYNVIEFQKAITELPLPWFQDGDNAVWLTLGVFIWDSGTQTMFDIQGEQAVAAVMQSVHDGVADGLATVKPGTVARRLRSVPVPPRWPKARTFIVL